MPRNREEAPVFVPTDHQHTLHPDEPYFSCRKRLSGTYCPEVVTAAAFPTRGTESIMSDLLRSFKMDKTTLSVASLSDQSDQRAFWATKTPHERLAALEFMRVVHYGYDPSTARLQRILAVGKLKEEKVE